MKTNSEPERVLVTLTKVAETFGFSRKSLQEWRRKGRGCPEKVDGKEDITAWREWFAAHPDVGTVKGQPKAVREELLCEKLKREIALQDIKLAEARRQVISVNEIGHLLHTIASRQRAELIHWCETESPPVIASGDLGEIRGSQRALCDRLCEHMESGIERWLRDLEESAK